MTAQFQNYAMPLVRRVFPSLYGGMSLKEHKGFVTFKKGNVQKPEITIGVYVSSLEQRVVGVQPLSQPIGLAYALRWSYDNNGEDFK